MSLFFTEAKVLLALLLLLLLLLLPSGCAVLPRTCDQWGNHPSMS
jgi:hypothetical protein